ncbi:DUF3029 family protein, partial [Escherichia coli]|nr:DUF3029 family protein [Escherichia coli]
NLLFEKEGQIGRYGKNDRANTFAHDVSATLAKLVDSTPVKYGLDGKALLHAQGGISLDHDVTPGVRLPYGAEPDPVT